jgi:hypothetical protein
VKKSLTAGVLGLALAAPLSLVAAGSRQPEAEPVTAADALPAYEIVAAVRDRGLEPIGQPQRRGAYYVMYAYDRRGTELRVIADAQLGDILSAAPARAVNTAYAPVYGGGPRIIEVPDADVRDDPAAAPDPDQPPDAIDEDDSEDADAAPPGYQAQGRMAAPQAPRRQLGNAPPQPPAERRAGLSAPPRDPLTPIYPTPRFTTRPSDAEKYTAAPPGSARQGY